MEKISVIVPVYKVEAYLDKCVQSIVDQTYKNLEIILVDDGSPDNCPTMCDEWSKRDDRIRVIHQKNAGGAQARNIALDLATGQLIAFVDSDDYISPDMYEYLYTLLQTEYDIAECEYMNVWDSGTLFPKTEEQLTEYTADEAMKMHIEDKAFRQLIWNKLYRREIVGRIRFPKGKSIDDEFFTFRLIGNAEKLIRTNRVLYAYRQQDESVMHSMPIHKRLQALEAKEERHQYILSHYPALELLSLKNLWLTALYQGQLMCRTQDCKQLQTTLDEIIGLLKKYPITPDAISYFGNKEQFWIIMEKRFFKITCVIRNMLHIGM